MEILRVRALRGPNLWCRHTAIEAVVALSATEQAAGARRELETRLRARFPSIGIIHPLGQEPSLGLPQALESAALALQAQAGCPVTFSRCTATIEAGTYQVVVQYTEEAVGREALRLAEALVRAADADEPFDVAQALAQLRELDEDVRLGPSTGAIVRAALARGIPYRRLTEGSVVQFGWGKRQRRIQAAEIDSTSAVAEAIAQDKDLTKRLLRAAGIPVPVGRVVLSAAEAHTAMDEIGGAVVVKPRDGHHGKGITVNIETHHHLEVAFGAARAVSDEVIVERFVSGHDFRLLVVGKELVAAARRDPPHVIGDGQHTIGELVEQVNSDPLRGAGHATSLTRISLDEIAKMRLAIQGYTVDSVPPPGARVILRNNSNLSTGGTAADVTDTVHPALAARAIEAAEAVGVHVAGVDVVCESVLQPLESQGGAIVEVNAAPGLRMHLNPSFGEGRPVGEAIVASLFAEGDDGRIPVVAVTGTNGKTTTVRLIAHLLSASGKCVGMTSTDGVYIGDQRIDSGDCSGPKSARNVLLHPDVEAAVFETARGGLLREGLGFDRCRIAVVTNVGKGDHLGLNYITTVEDLAVLKRVIVQNVAADGTAVLNAADPIVAQMAESCPGEVIFFARDRQHPVLAAHHTQGKRIVYVEDDAVVIAHGPWTLSMALRDIPATRAGTLAFQVDNVMAAVGAAWALGVEWPVVRAGLQSFSTDSAAAPGRFNVMEYRGATVIADYGHNPDAMVALVDAVRSLPARRRSVVISGAGDRRDEDIRQQTEILGALFDEVILYQDQCQRGRADGEVVALLREGLQRVSRPIECLEIRGELLAIDTALARLQEGDLCLVLVDQIDTTVAYLREKTTSTASGGSQVVGKSTL